MLNLNVPVLAIAVALVATSVASIKPFGGQSLKLLVIGGRINVDDNNMEVISDVEKIDISKEGSEGSNRAHEASEGCDKRAELFLL